MKSTQELQQELDDLLAENSDILEKIQEVIILESRLRELNGGFNSKGLISIARQKLNDSKYPIYKEEGNWNPAIRIVNVDKKWIYLKYDGHSEKEITRYKIDTGWKERARYVWSAIDPKRAIEIWNAHNAEQVKSC